MTSILARAPVLEQIARSVFPEDLSQHQRFAVRALRFRPAVLVDRTWRVKGCPAPKVTEFALATLIGMGMVELSSPTSMVLTRAGRAMAKRLDVPLPPQPCSSPLRAIARRI